MKKVLYVLFFILTSTYSFSGGCSLGISKVSINTSDGLKCVLTMSLHESAGGCSGIFGFEAGTQWYFNGVKIKMGESITICDTGVYRAHLGGMYRGIMVTSNDVKKNPPIEQKGKLVDLFQIKGNTSMTGIFQLLTPSEYNSLANYHISICNIKGEKVLEQNSLLLGLEQTIDLSNKGKGMFILRIIIGGELITKRLIVL